jgi:hypothetical protein
MSWIKEVGRMETIKKLQSTWIKKVRAAFKGTFGQMSLEWTNKWPNSLTAR